jgi:mRNA interferase MazF
MGVSEVRRGDVYLVMLNPARGGEIRNLRPCLVVSPDELNGALNTFVVAPMTTGGHVYPFRIACKFQGKAGHIVLDQVRTVDRSRMARRLGKIQSATLREALAALRMMFEH